MKKATKTLTTINNTKTLSNEKVEEVRIAEYRSAAERQQRLLQLIKDKGFKMSAEEVKQDLRREVGVFIGSKIYWIPTKMGNLFPGGHCTVSYLTDEKGEIIKKSMVVIAR